jgi:hypothetical protein
VLQRPDFWQNGLAVAVHASPHEVNQTKHQLPGIVFEAPEVLTRLDLCNDRIQETGARQNHLPACYGVKVGWDATRYFLHDHGHPVDGVFATPRRQPMIQKFRFKRFRNFFAFMGKTFLCLVRHQQLLNVLFDVVATFTRLAAGTG